MMRFNTLIITALALTLLPLSLMIHSPNLSHFWGQAWNFWGTIYVCVLLILYVFNDVYIHCSKNLLTLSWTISVIILLLISFFSNQPSHQAWRVFMLYLMALASWPLLKFTIKSTGKELVLQTVVLISVLQSIWGVLQFSWQRNLGFEKIGESLLRNDIAGVAKFLMPETSLKLIRAYGPDAHPNILAGALLLGVVANLVLIYRRGQVRNYDFLTLPILSLGIFLTFSRSGWIGLVIAGICLLILQKNKLQRKDFIKMTGIIGLILLVLLPLVAGRMKDVEDQAVAARLKGIDAAQAIFLRDHSLFGIGPGQYENYLYDLWNKEDVKYADWEIEPVHSVPLLMLIELGWLEFLVFTLGVIYVFIKINPREKWFLAALLPLLFFDYYFLRQPGVIAFGLTVYAAIQIQE